MGYYTGYTLEVRGIKTEEEFNRLHQELDDRELFGYVFEDDDRWDPEQTPKRGAFFSCYEAQKWYESDDVMTALSVQFPEMVFHLGAAGETPDDLWDAYYQNGVCESGGVKHYTPKDIPWDNTWSVYSED